VGLYPILGHFLCSIWPVFAPFSSLFQPETGSPTGFVNQFMSFGPSFVYPLTLMNPLMFNPYLSDNPSSTQMITGNFCSGHPAPLWVFPLARRVVFCGPALPPLHFRPATLNPAS
jgi:hypothetical protein